VGGWTGRRYEDTLLCYGRYGRCRSGLRAISHFGGRLVCQLILAAQAPGTDLKPFLLAVNNDFSTMNIRHPPSLRVTFRMAHIESCLRGLSTDFTFCHDFMLLY